MRNGLISSVLIMEIYFFSGDLNYLSEFESFRSVINLLNTSLVNQFYILFDAHNL